MIVMDLEWNRGNDDVCLDEVLQIGAVKIDGAGARISDTFNAYIRPTVHVELNVAAALLPDIDKFRKSELSFTTAYMKFVKWCADDTVFASWGSSDWEVLRKNADYWKLPSPDSVDVIDLQASFSGSVGASSHMALYKAVQYCMIPDSFDFHSALNDAMYAALLTEWIEPDRMILHKSVNKRAELLNKRFDRQQKHRSEYFNSPAGVLNSRCVRRIECPICGRRIWIDSWHSCDEEHYYSMFSCKEHGEFICRLTVMRNENGWRGCSTVPAITMDELENYQRAKAAVLHKCLGREGKRKAGLQRRRKAISIQA